MSLAKVPAYNYRLGATIEIIPEAAEVRITRSAEPVKTDRETGEFVPDPDAIVFNRGVSLETPFARSSETFDYSGAPFAESASVLRNGPVPVVRIEAATARDSAWVPGQLVPQLLDQDRLRLHLGQKPRGEAAQLLGIFRQGQGLIEHGRSLSH